MIAAAMSSGNEASLTNLPAGRGDELDQQVRLQLVPSTTACRW